jgi:hypothetical protein
MADEEKGNHNDNSDLIPPDITPTEAPLGGDEMHKLLLNYAEASAEERATSKCPKIHITALES